jgi:hypothetical protein
MSQPIRSRPSPDDLEKEDIVPTGANQTNILEIDLVHYHEQCAGRLVLDPKCVFFLSLLFLADHASIREAGIEFGDEVASRLKLSPDGRFVLWPQPSDDPEDPQNVRLCLTTVIKYGLIYLITFSGPNGKRPSS